MKKKLIGAFTTIAFIGLGYSWMYLACIANPNYVSPEDYACMSQQIVEESLQKK